MFTRLSFRTVARAAAWSSATSLAAVPRRFQSPRSTDARSQASSRSSFSSRASEVTLFHFAARDDRLQEQHVAISHERNDEGVSVDIHDHDALAWVGSWIWMIKHVEEPTGRHVENDILERDASFSFESLAFFIVPIELRQETIVRTR